MKCPNCTVLLIKNPNHAKLVFECKNCKAVWGILSIEKPVKEIK